MSKPATVTLIANAGVLVEYGDTRLLLDGIHTWANSNFSGLSLDQIRVMMEGNRKLRDVEYLLFSHEHQDHITPSLVEEYLQNNGIKSIFLQQDGTARLKKLHETIEDLHIPVSSIHLRDGEAWQCVLEPGISVMFRRTIHMGLQYMADEHYSISLTLGSHTILFCGDADTVDTNFDADEDIDTIFVNPLFYHHADGRALLENVIKPRRTVIYHVPFVEDDKKNFRSLTKRDTERHPGQHFQLLRLWDPGQQIFLGDW